MERTELLRHPLGKTSFLVLLSLVVSGCQEEELSGYEYRIQATGDENGCTEAPADMSEKFAYRLVLDGPNIELAVGEDMFATGSFEDQACKIVYESVVWEERHSGGEISWQLYGEAIVQTPGTDCGEPDALAGGLDWGGSERFILKSSTEEAGMAPGCEYTSTLAGTLQKGQGG